MHRDPRGSRRNAFLLRASEDQIRGAQVSPDGDEAGERSEALKGLCLNSLNKTLKL